METSNEIKVKVGLNLNYFIGYAMFSYIPLGIFFALIGKKEEIAISFLFNFFYFLVIYLLSIYLVKNIKPRFRIKKK